MRAARPTPHSIRVTRNAKTASPCETAATKAKSRPRHMKPKKMLDSTRAQFRPALVFHAIQSHRRHPMTPPTIPLTREFAWWTVVPDGVEE